LAKEFKEELSLEKNKTATARTGHVAGVLDVYNFM
jgi:hypothetical protein